MSTTEGETLVRIHPAEIAYTPAPAFTPGQVKRIDDNMLRMQDAIAKLQRAKPRRFRTASAARVNPDRLWFGYVILAINGVFAIGTLAASFFGQYAFAQFTYLPAWLLWVVPAAFDVPIMSSSFTALVFRKRKQSTWRNWTLMLIATIGSVTVNVSHVLEQAGFFRGRSLGVPDWVGVSIMGIMPILVLVSWENLSRLLVKPTGETSDKPPAPARRPTTRKTRSTK